MKSTIDCVRMSAVFALALCACADSASPDESTGARPLPVPAQRREERIESRARLQQEKRLERFEQTDPSGETGEVPPELLARVYDDLEQRTGGDRSEFNLLRAESAQWNDGALGCAEPGQSYQQVPIDGFHVVLGYKGKTYDYRIASRGFFKLCPEFSVNSGASTK